MTATHNSTAFVLLWIAAAILVSTLQAEARRRDPLSELARGNLNASVNAGVNHHGQRRLLEEEGSGSEGLGLLTHESVRGTRSLAGSNVHVPVATSPDDHLVKDLPLLNKDDFPGDHWAGLLPVNSKKDGYLFYWLFAPDTDAVKKAKDKGIVNQDESNVPLLIWLNGGPACSSMDGLWIENGPFRLDPSKGGDWNNIKIDEYSWHKAPAYTLYIDQPVGTGLSFTKSGNYPDNDKRINEDFYYFLTEFMKLHATTLGVNPQKHKSGNKKIMTLQRPLFFSGESHAGHYIPSMMNHIRKKNLNVQTLQKSNGVIMPLNGGAIGNGWFDPVYQYSAHEAAYGYGLIGKAQERALAEKEQECRKDLANQEYDSEICFNLLSAVTGSSMGKTNPYQVSQYDTRQWESRTGPRDFPLGHKDVEAYLGQKKKIPNASIQKVLTAIHATSSWDSGQRYRECTDPPYYALSHQDGLGVVPDVVELLEHGAAAGDDDDEQDQIRLMFFNGVHDLICNHAGNENALENLPWKHRDDFIRAERYGWKSASSEKHSGYAKEFQNLIFLKVMDAGHMVPMDVPLVALEMMTTFLYSSNNNNNKHPASGTFSTYAQKLPLSVATRGENCPACPGCPTSSSSSSSNNNNDACPVCNDNDDGSSSSKCTEHECKKQGFEFGDNDNNNNMVSGILSGILSFLVSMVSWWGCRKCFCNTKKNSRNNCYQKAGGQIELSDGGYRDDGENDNENGDDFEDEIKIN